MLYASGTITDGDSMVWFRGSDVIATGDVFSTMTYPVINNSRNVMFLVAGEAKAEAVREVIDGKKDPAHFPAQSVRPKDGRLMWFLDEHAAKYLKHKASSVHN